VEKAASWESCWEGGRSPVAPVPEALAHLEGHRARRQGHARRGVQRGGLQPAEKALHARRRRAAGAQPRSLALRAAVDGRFVSTWNQTKEGGSRLNYAGVSLLSTRGGQCCWRRPSAASLGPAGGGGVFFGDAAEGTAACLH